MNMKLSFDEFPPSWEYCFNDGCELHESCIHWCSTEVLPEDKLVAKCVLPAAARLDSCPFYKKLEEVRMAWGFKTLLKDVKAVDIKNIRREIWDIVGSRASYYRYNRGELKLTPELQDEIISLLRKYGYTQDLAFDNYENNINI